MKVFYGKLYILVETKMTW